MNARKTIGVDVMRKISNILLVLMLMMSIFSLALAAEEDDNPEDENDVELNETELEDNQTKYEIQIMNNSLGAEIRLLQLEKAIFTNLLKGRLVVQILQDLEINTTELEKTLDNLSMVLEDVRAADPAADDAVEIFVTLKHESRILTKQFRDILHIILNDEMITHIREHVRNMNNAEVQNCSQRIQNRIRQFNKNQLHRLYGMIGEKNTTCIEEYFNGTLSLEQTKLQLHTMINQMTKEKRYLIFSEIKQENIQRTIRAQRSFENAKQQGIGNGHGRPH